MSQSLYLHLSGSAAPLAIWTRAAGEIKRRHKENSLQRRFFEVNEKLRADYISIIVFHLFQFMDPKLSNMQHKCYSSRSHLSTSIYVVSADMLPSSFVFLLY